MNKATILPADIYQVVNKSMLNECDKLVLNMLYMPIIGNNAVSLYLTLYNELKAASFISSEIPHHHLISCMSMSMNDIKESRLKLEGIGLLRTYYMEGNINSYVYELYSPLSANEFFSHPIFNMVLFNNVGKEEYKRLVNYFKMPTINLKGYTEITVPFDMTFKSKNYTPMEIEENIQKKEKLKLNYELDFDFDTLITSMPKNLFNVRTLTKTNKELIINLAFLYDIDPITMSDIIKTALNEKGLIDVNELRKNVRKYYQVNNSNRLPSLIFKTQADYLKSPDCDNSKRGRIIKVFENTNPYNFLVSKYKGVKPTNRDMSVLEMLLVDLKLNPAVVNVLIDYVLKSNNNKLVKSYIETIAGQWKRMGIETAKEAMEIAEKEHNKYKKKENKFKNIEESIPVWFDEKIEKTTATEDEKKELERLLKEYK